MSNHAPKKIVLATVDNRVETRNREQQQRMILKKNFSSWQATLFTEKQWRMLETELT